MADEEHKSDAGSVPEDLETAQELIQELKEQLAARDREVEALRHRIDQLTRRLFGRQAEKIDFDARQLLLHSLFSTEAGREAVAALVADEDDGAAKRASSGPRRRGRQALPAELPRRRIEIKPAPEELVCEKCAGGKRQIGEDVTEELEYVPASFVVNQYVRPKLACPICESGVVEAELPARPIDKGIPGPGLLAQVVTSKYADHLPLYRQETIFTRSGIHIARQTQCEWVGAVAGLMEPIVREMRREVLGSRVIHCDDTSVTVQDRDHPGGSRNGYLWVYVGEQGDLVFDYTDSRSRDGPLAFLEGYRGYLQADAYAGYDEVFRRGDVTEVGCWAHARRRVYEAVKTALEPATLLLALIRRLYRVEREAREAKMDAAERLVLRQEKSRPILGLIEEQLESLSPRCLPKSPLGEAIGYAQRQWQALMRYTEDGILAIDNNVAENGLRQVVLGRKNYLFFGSDAGGRRAAILYSLVGTCKKIGLDPFAYLRDVIARVSTHPARRITELTPRGWKAQLLSSGA